MDTILKGIRVLDLGQIYNGSYCGLLLGYMGAEVIKLEPPQGENLRRRLSGEGKDSLAFVMLNSNKKGITLNLKSDEGKELFYELVRKSDVLIENFAAGVMDRLGLGYEALRQVNPRLIYASGKGYGSSGPYKDYLAMDLTVQAMSGVMSVTGFPGSPPVKAGPQIADFMGGIHLAAGVLGALFHRERTGRGQLVEVSMHDAMYPALTSQLEAFYRSGGQAPEKTGNRQGGGMTCPYNVYRAKDGHVAIICVNDAHWANLCRVMGREDLYRREEFRTNLQRAAHMDYIDQQVESWTITQSKHEIHQRLLQAHVPSAPVLTLREVANDPHYLARGMIREVAHPQRGCVRVPGMPIRFSQAGDIPLAPSPLLGQHNEEVYANLLNLDRQAMAELKQRGII